MINNGIYKIVNSVNNKFYIGSASSTGGFRKRWNEHKSALRNNRHPNKYLQQSWNKYGEEAFVFEIIEIVTNDTILEREQHYIDTLEPHYNLCKIAGNTKGRKLSDKQKKLLSELAKLRVGDKNAFFGKKHSEDTKKASSLRMSGKYLGDKSPLYGKNVSPETKKLMSEAKKGKTSKLKIPIKQLDLNGNIIKIWNSISDASTALKINGCWNIVSCLKGRIKTAYGFKWEY